MTTIKQRFLHTRLGKKLRVQRRFLALWPQLTRLGWQRSIEESFPVDRHGNALPWFTYPSLFFLQDRIASEMRVFEYGCGGSTLWWSKRVAHVTSCEHELAWLRLIEKRTPANVELIHRALTPEGGYTGAILEYRLSSTSSSSTVDSGFSAPKIHSQRSTSAACSSGTTPTVVDYKEGIDFLMDSGFKRLDFAGDGPINAFRSCTSIFYRNLNCLSI